MTEACNLSVSFNVNGVDVVVEVEPRRLLADVLREDLGLKGTHLGCEHGVCGACTVLMDGVSVRSCLVLAPQAEGRRIRTVESLRTEDGLHTLQEAFHQAHALQCGFCTPGFLMTAVAIPTANGPLSEEEIRNYLSGNICRCTGYANIVDAVSSWVATQPAGTSWQEPSPSLDPLDMS